MLFQEGGEGRRVVVRVHPLIETNKTSNISFTSCDIPWDDLNKVVPETFLTQAPVTSITIQGVDYVHKRPRCPITLDGQTDRDSWLEHDRLEHDRVNISGSSRPRPSVWTIFTLECETDVTFGAVRDQVVGWYKPRGLQWETLVLRIVTPGSVAEDSTFVQVAKKVLADQLKSGSVDPQDQESAVRSGWTQA